MVKIKVKRPWVLWLKCLPILAISYPLSVLASAEVPIQFQEKLNAPFLFSWIGVWVFSGAGGFGAGLIKIDDVDAKLRNPVLAKFFIGLFWGVGICSIIDALTNTPQGALTFFALFVSSFITPVTAGLMVYVSNQKRLNGAFDQALKRKTGIDLSRTDYDKKDSENDTPKL